MTVIHLPPNAQLVPDGHVTSSELITRAGITYRQLDYWVRTGLLIPANGIDPGSGFPRHFAAHELVVACLVKRLLDAGLSPRAAFDHARALADTGTTRIAGIAVHLPEDL